MLPIPFEIMFLIVLILSIVSVIFWWVIFVFRAVKGKKSVLQGEVMSESQPIVKEKEIIREIVKMRCPYCGNVYDETLDKCPHCGAKKP